MGGKRRTQAQRSEEMRARLAKAAFEVVAERGHSAFRTAAVAAQAGVSQGAQVHHFATKDGLTLAAIRYAFSTANERTRARIDAIGDADPIAALLADFRDFFMGAEFWVGLDITMDASKKADLAQEIRAIVAEYRRPAYEGWTKALSVRGWSPDDAGQIVTMSGALIAGLGMRSLWDETDRYFDALMAKWSAMIHATWPRHKRGE